MMRSVRIDSKSHIELPEEIRQALGVAPGDEVVLTVEGGCVRLLRATGDWAETLLGLHREVWEGVDALECVRGEREGWTRREPGR
jgi:AbrB family looped-hinge helix DNA binding protein